jgi:hypothetical protein
MEARTTLRGTGFPRGMVAVVLAVLAAFLLGGAGGYVAKTLSLPAAPVPVHIVAGQPGASEAGSAWNYSTRRSGSQTVGGPAVSPAPSAPVQEPGSERSGNQFI